jgi:hypothetical protein
MEESFDESVKSTNISSLAISELDSMIETYNDQIKNLVTLRFDAELFAILMVSEPNVPKWRTKKGDADIDLAHQRTTIRIIRNQIIEKIKNMKKDYGSTV